MNATQKENTRVLYSIIAGFPAERVLLNAVRWPHTPTDEFLKPECGAVGCSAGIASAHPHFIAQEFEWYGGYARLNGSDDLQAASLVLFGDKGIFQSGPSGVNGKREALRRLRRHLFRNGKITLNRNYVLWWEEMRITS